MRMRLTLMQMVVTIYEETPEKAIEVIRALRDDHDAVELRVDAFGGRAVDWAAVRAATAKPVIATNRGGVPVADADADLIDVEWGQPIPAGRCAILSHQASEGGSGRDVLLSAMRAGPWELAVCPPNFARNCRRLAPLDRDRTPSIPGLAGHGR